MMDPSVSGVSLVSSVEPAFFALIAYFLGCISFGYYVVRLSTGGDIRSLGSGNAGARNAGRVLGRGAFLLTLVGDGGKGILAVALTAAMQADPLSHALSLGAVVAGHIWPVQLRFRGGKGFATAIGGIMAFNYQLGIVVLAVAGLLVLLMRRGTPAALGATVLSPAIAYALDMHALTIVTLVVVAVMILVAHRGYFRALLKPGSTPSHHDTGPT
jgi:glycerol-3-phosphate acyltransferase PlsY